MTLDKANMNILNSEVGDLTFLQGKDNSIGAGKGKQSGQENKGMGKGGDRPMSEGVHRTVC
jgi:glutamate decarboxylase